MAGSSSLRLAAAAALLATASAGTFVVDDVITYVRGTGVEVAGVFDPAVWHDSSTSGDMQLKLRLLEDATATGNLQSIVSTSFITVTGASPLGAPVTGGYSVGAATLSTCSGGGCTAGSSWIDILLTFDSTAPGGTTYSIRYNCGLLKDGTDATANTGDSTACTYGTVAAPLTVKIGWVPVVTILDADSNSVTSSWIDLGPNEAADDLLVAHTLLIDVTPGKTLDFTDADPTTTTVFGGTDGAGNVYDFAKKDLYDTASLTPFNFGTAEPDSTNKKWVKFPFALGADFAPGQFLVRFESGALTRTDGAKSAQTVFLVKAGFRVLATFLETNAFDVPDDSATPDDVTWFPADKSLALKVEGANLPTGYFLTDSATAYGIGAGQLLAGMTSLPGAITAGINTNVDVNILDDETHYQYPLVTATVRPSTYSFNISQGVLITKKAATTVEIRNAPLRHQLAIGFKPLISIIEGDAPAKVTDVDERKDVTTHWLNLDANTAGDAPALAHAIAFRPPTNYRFVLGDLTSADAATIVTIDADTNTDLDGMIAFETAFASRLNANAEAVYQLTDSYMEIAFTTVSVYTPGSYDLILPAQRFVRDDSVKSCKVVVPVRAGFGPTLNFVDLTTPATPREDMWVLNTNAAVVLQISATDLDETVAPTYGIASGRLLAGMASLPGGRAGFATSGITSTAAVVVGTDMLSYPLIMTGIEPGSYKFTVANGALAVGAVRNYATDATLKIGYELDWQIYDYDADSDTRHLVAIKGQAAEAYLNPNHEHYIVFKPGTFGGASKSFSAATMAALPAAADLFVDTAGDALAATDFLAATELVTGETDEGRIVYKLVAEAAATVGAYDVYLPEAAFSREFTNAANVDQTISLNVGFGFTVDFCSTEVIADVDTTAVTGNCNKWWRGDSDVALWIQLAATLPTASVDWNTIFPGNKPGACEYTAGVVGTIIGGFDADAHGYSLANIDQLKPGQYPFEIPAGLWVNADSNGNYYVRQNLKVGFPTTVDFLDGAKKPIMLASDTDNRISETLMPGRSDWIVRAKIGGATAEQALALWNTASAATALTADASFIYDDDDDPAVDFTATDYPALLDGMVDIVESTTSQFVALYAFDDTTTAGNLEATTWQFMLMDGVYCVNAAADYAEEQANICNAATDPALAGKIKFGFATLVTVDGFTTSAELTAGTPALDYTAETAVTGVFYNIFDANLATVVVMPICAANLKITVTWPAAPATKNWEDKVSMADSFAVPALPASAAAAMQYKWSSASATARLTPGTYDIEFLPEIACDADNFCNARLRIRLVIGPKPIFYKMDLATPIVPRNPGGPFSTNANSVYLSLVLSQTAITTKFTDILMVKNAAGAIVTGAVTIGTTIATVSTDITDPLEAAALTYSIGVDGLTDGVYTFIIGGDLSDTSDDMLTYNSEALIATTADFEDELGATYKASEFATGLKVTFIVDRLAPTPLNVAYTGSSVYTRTASGHIALPDTLFNDVGTPDSHLAIAVAADDNKGLTLVGEHLEGAYLFSAFDVRDPAGTTTFKVTGTDDAGNSNVALFSLPILRRETGTLTVIDLRGVQNKGTLYSGGSDSLTTNALKLKVVADFNIAVTGVLKQHLSCKVGCAACSFSSSPDIVVTPAPGGKRFTFEFTIAAAQVVHGATIKLGVVTSTTVAGVAKKIVSLTGGFDMVDPATVEVVVDKQAPTPVTYIAPYRATVGAKYMLTLPSKLYYDDLSDSKKIKLISASPSAQFGLAFTVDYQGNATISGIPLAQPPLSSDNRVVFNVVGQDEAGNSGSPVQVVIEIHPALATAPVFTVKGALLTFTEKDTSLDADKILGFDNTAIFTAPTSARFKSVVAYLTRPENDDDSGSETLTLATDVDAESVTGDSACSSGCAVDYAMDPLTGEGSIGLTYLDADGEPALTALMVRTWVRALTYSNTRTDITSGTRIIRVDVWGTGTIMIGQRIDALGNTVKGTESAGHGVVASSARTLRVVAVNNAPTLDVSTTSAWDEATPADAVVFSSVTIEDSDDNDMTAAYVSIALVAGSKDEATPYGACDKSRDKIYLPAGYHGQGASDPVSASWSPASCTVTLSPTAPRNRVTKDELMAAMEALLYTNLDPKNPVNFSTTDADRFRYITALVEDAANQGKLADKKRSIKEEDPAGRTTTNVLEMSLIDNAPEVNLRSIFSAGGILSSTDKFANLETTYDDLGIIKIKAFPLVTPAIYTSDGHPPDPALSGSKLVFQIKLDLMPVMRNGVAVPGSFARSQIMDVDTAAPPASTEIFIEYVDSNGDVQTFANLITAFPAVFDTSYTNPASGATYTTGFTYSATEESTITFVILDNAPLGDLGIYKFRLTFGRGRGDLAITDNTADGYYQATEVDFFVDVRQKACVDSGAGRADPNDADTETYIVDRLNADTAADGILFQLTGATTAITDDATYLPKFFPDNALCAYLPTSVVASSGTAYDVSRGGYSSFKTALDNAVSALSTTGASIQAQIVALKEVRNAARGGFSINIPAGSLASRGSMDFTANKANNDAIALLPSVTDSVETVDTDVAIKLQPAGTTFSVPVKVCLFAGDTPEGSYKVMAMAQQKDPGDPTKGYLPWEKLFDQSFNPATGEVCGYTLHFSVFAPITRPQALSYTVPKAHLMGGSCPNQCSGHGACRQEGQCACFAGFEGYDCSMRTCPSAESWGQDQEVMHTQSECAGRGVCQRDTGTCSCFDGFEGSACERATCPNDCSGHGRCRTLAELPKVQQYGYSSWEIKRLQKCVCDGGYTGGDCSLRICPFGDDPETICSYEGRQVQRLTLDFVTDPTGTGNPDVDLGSDQFALIFTTASGKNFTTPMIDDIWEGTSASTTAIANALMTLPEFAVVDVQVSSAPTTAQSLSVSYDITFTGPTNTGNEILMSCPYNSLGSTGCPAPGCRPKFTQLRAFQVPYMPPAVQVSPLTVLQQPLPLGSDVGDNGAGTNNVFGVETTLVVNKYVVPGTADLVYTYKFLNTKIYGQSVNVAGDNAALTIAETPVPPSALRNSVPGPYGLLFDIGSDTQLGIDFSGAGPFTYTFAWRLPMCSVSVVTSAAPDLEKAECSNRGLCSRETGECECFTGYAGYSCSQQTINI